ncbi:putative Acyl-CoA N-acyltransferase [Vibrio nigripulchritudo SFn27]|uniref:Acyl-CoA N-acyltransferase n=2 Tax=Vibrio nigripulchritudo TaxID=28173 RepID=A0AAV2VVS7_9VIBR|nr:putative Acyl-CoA N-acyltransferase [Vibrio nigripulchritudo SFn118]CCN83377.1 putative Acyl-CoA N-acyltransferase [Vibrio nigripulchritudo BLFn1]CCN88736.1 putative Acyl-CoA N-acyltransferase [Vibrio nigripulchritudo SFn27]CCN95035.1 putative Acyl-CoA N-acyltransferase [Vibrio nigripulchritudo ENn2]CCO41080.1 putative Acyl-CoA N-acyltransferase [Vibrio nigripulchritudo SFn135]CCO48550.1 putative Acyl-CoA N-acyltransferase [Vibrio nigripulchritudo SOn1]CCO52398.1 putative Acyl-CoA N-acyltr
MPFFVYIIIMIAIKRPKIKDFSSLIELNVTAEQSQFVETFDHLYEHRDKQDVIYSISDSGTPIGFFALDQGFEKKFTFVKNREIGLKNFVIDHRFQRKGHGKATLERLLTYLYTAYPNYDSICVMVEKDNEAAYQCFLSADFKDTNKPFYENSKQIRILRKTITAPF